ncbi:DUF1330 domain-containing protein [Oceanomicrobium pacificus]|uniref:DUF1330 domain-containing protein n=1 Tax=Oceanomicrobium pacificus TaxID=2692916 RepID=A0A6B0TTG9_9RHOB|nr:DUF1330 domain-containing protein [Oceanomicrobium pacificus]MXU64532.1 DUF1330 domain-containing protein [Oceanomicrobium pacificus]
MTVHAFVHMVISDPEKLAAYRTHAAAALARHGGKLASAAPKPATLEGALPDADLAAVLEFPDAAAARAWHADPALAEVHALRRDSGQSAILLLA